jgi:hypothetical protein
MQSLVFQSGETIRTFASPLATELDDPLESIGDRVGQKLAGDDMRFQCKGNQLG